MIRLSETIYLKNLISLHLLSRKGMSLLYALLELWLWPSLYLGERIIQNLMLIRWVLVEWVSNVWKSTKFTFASTILLVRIEGTYISLYYVIVAEGKESHRFAIFLFPLSNLCVRPYDASVVFLTPPLFPIASCLVYIVLIFSKYYMR